MILNSNWWIFGLHISFPKIFIRIFFTKKKYCIVQVTRTAQKQQLRWNKSAFYCVQVDCFILILEYSM